MRLAAALPQFPEPTIVTLGSDMINAKLKTSNEIGRILSITADLIPPTVNAFLMARFSETQLTYDASRSSHDLYAASDLLPCQLNFNNNFDFHACMFLRRIQRGLYCTFVIRAIRVYVPQTEWKGGKFVFLQVISSPLFTEYYLLTWRKGSFLDDFYFTV